MKKIAFTWIILTLLLSACKESPNNSENDNTKTDISFTEDTSAVAPAVVEQQINQESPECKDSETLVYQNEAFSTYTEDKLRGTGVASFTLNVNDRFPVYNMNDSSFGEIVLNEDLTYYTLSMPEKVVARNLVTEHDVASFDFDAEDPGADKKYLYIYINKQKRKVDKSEVKYTYDSWDKYLKYSSISLKSCNIAIDASGKFIRPKSNEAIFKVLEVKGDKIRIAADKACTPDGTPYEDIQGWIKWKNGSSLIVNLTNCN